VLALLDALVVVMPPLVVVVMPPVVVVVSDPVVVDSPPVPPLVAVPVPVPLLPPPEVVPVPVSEPQAEATRMLAAPTTPKPTFHHDEAIISSLLWIEVDARVERPERSPSITRGPRVSPVAAPRGDPGASLPPLTVGQEMSGSPRSIACVDCGLS
jgi:hypothetical protein